jgi:hypothetical protein
MPKNPYKNEQDQKIARRVSELCVMSVVQLEVFVERARCKADLHIASIILQEKREEAEQIEARRAE